jgi:hypothetical protein
MESVQGPERLVFPDLTALARPALRVFDEIANRQPNIALDRREDVHDPAPPTEFHVQPLLAVGRGDTLLVDLGGVAKPERVLSPPGAPEK